MASCFAPSGVKRERSLAEGFDRDAEGGITAPAALGVKALKERSGARTFFRAAHHGCIAVIHCTKTVGLV